MFKNQPINEKEIETIIGPSVKVKGEFETEGSIQIEGQLEGTLKIGSDLIVGEKAKVTANLQANRVMVSGKVQGNIKAKESLELTETAEINGDIDAVLLSVDPGAQINGKIKMIKKDNQETKKARKQESKALEIENVNEQKETE
ncbi:polymer-forming cytoskeletal protein [Candidatus Falkowbacteria bacterium]|jgi:cytoskeletal protein CcmA (bactofilin family)|nr:polymer-forming cytoskeletal protein [Candidatus Falkowbacteria bacterium]MBT4433206.1 polymer-forming cytoskeletal protein [Candidatus Falkowbacteria bacterium]